MNNNNSFDVLAANTIYVCPTGGDHKYHKRQMDGS